MKREFVFFTIIFLFLVSCSAAFASERYVSANTGSDTTGTGSQAAPWATIQHAINAVTASAFNPANIRVAAGTYYENLTMKSFVNLWGGYHGRTWARDIAVNQTIIDGSQLNSCIKFEFLYEGRVDGFTIRNGKSNIVGGGIYCRASSPTIQNNIISGNSGTGGGILCLESSSPTIQNNVISGNSSLGGGGIYCYSSSPMIQNNIISGNSGATYGAGIFCASSSPTIQNNIISGNSGVLYGGGIKFLDSTSTTQNNTISGNSASSSGGGIYCESSAPSIRNTVFYGNTNYDIYEHDADSDVFAYFSDFYGSTPGIWYDEGTTNLTIINQVNGLAEADNNISVSPRFLPALTGTSTNVSYNATTSQSTLTNSSARYSPGALKGLLLNPNTTQNLQFAIAANTATTITIWGNVTGVATTGNSYEVFDYHLGSGSGLIDAGTDLGVTTTDIDGESRPQGAAYDIGADEYPAPVIADIPDGSISDGSPYTGPTPTLTQGGSPITWSLVTGPSGMTINSSTGVVSWLSPTVTGSPYTVTIRATNVAGSDDETWSLTVIPPPGEGEGEIEEPLFEVEPDGEVEAVEPIPTPPVEAAESEGEFEDQISAEPELEPVEGEGEELEPTPTPTPEPSEGETPTEEAEGGPAPTPTPAPELGEGEMESPLPTPTPTLTPAEGEGEIESTPETDPEPDLNEEPTAHENSAEKEQEREAEPSEENPREGNPSPSLTSPTVNVCPVAGTSASTALATKLDWVRQWRDEGLLATGFGEKAVAVYYQTQCLKGVRQKDVKSRKTGFSVGPFVFFGSFW